MTELAKKVLHILQTAKGKSSFSATELNEYGISESNAQIAFKELEANGYIYVSRKYVSGTLAYTLS